LLKKFISFQWQDQAKLLEGASAGNAQAIGVLVDLLSPKAHALAWRMLGDAREAEDVVQDALIKLLGSKQFEARSSLSTYFHTIVSRICFDRLRAGKLDLVSDADWGEIIDEANLSPDSQCELGQSKEFIQNALSQLNPRQRLAITLWTYEDANADKIAKIMGIDSNAAHQLLHRAKLNLKKIIGENHAR
jgi:RNA polymerase sigma-70 factor (ECF subfamily)